MAKALTMTLALLTAAACDDSCAQKDAPPIPEAQMRAKWEKLFGTLSHDCDQAIVWMVLDAANYQQSCPPNTAACIYVTWSCPTAFILKEDASMPALWAHEEAHWLGWCQWGQDDHQHQNPLVWGPDGYVQSFSTPG